MFVYLHTVFVNMASSLLSSMQIFFNFIWFVLGYFVLEIWKCELSPLKKIILRGKSGFYIETSNFDVILSITFGQLRTVQFYQVGLIILMKCQRKIVSVYFLLAFHLIMLFVVSKIDSCWSQKPFSVSKLYLGNWLLNWFIEIAEKWKKKLGWETRKVVKPCWPGEIYK